MAIRQFGGGYPMMGNMPPMPQMYSPYNPWQQQQGHWHGGQWHGVPYGGGYPMQHGGWYGMQPGFGGYHHYGYGMPSGGYPGYGTRPEDYDYDYEYDYQY